jgi:hypothetical protein
VSTVRIEPGEGFTVFRNAHRPKGGSLSFRAFGLWVFLRSMPDDWEVRTSHLTKQGREGRDAIYTALNELVAAGYAFKETYRTDGNLRRVRYVIRAEPLPDTGFQDAGMAGQQSKDSTKAPRATKSYDYTNRARRPASNRLRHVP